MKPITSSDRQSMKPITSSDRQTLRPHPEEGAHRSRACPTSATLKCRNRQQPISMRGRPEALEGRRMAAGTISLAAVLRDARILRQAQERAPQDEADGSNRYDSYHGNALRALQQQTARLLDGCARVFRKLIIRSAADRMADDDELVLRHAGDTAHELGRADEPLRHNGDGRYPLPLRCDRIMQTAR